MTILLPVTSPEQRNASAVSARPLVVSALCWRSVAVLQTDFSSDQFFFLFCSFKTLLSSPFHQIHLCSLPPHRRATLPVGTRGYAGTAAVPGSAVVWRSPPRRSGLCSQDSRHTAELRTHTDRWYSGTGKANREPNLGGRRGLILFFVRFKNKSSIK